MRLLIAEDELDLAEALTVFFEKNHFTVDAVHNGFDAYEYAAAGGYDAIILDIMMPKLDGIQVLQRLRAEEIGTPVMMLTAKGRKDDRITGFNAGAAAYLAAALKKGEGYGYCGNYRFYVTADGSGARIAIFLDCYQSLRAVRTVLVWSLAADALCTLLVLLLVVLLSRRAIDPVVRSAEQQKQFITDASHELKTPITVIATSLKVLEMEVGQQKWIDKARAQTEKLTSLLPAHRGVTSPVSIPLADSTRRSFHENKARCAGRPVPDGLPDLPGTGGPDTPADPAADTPRTGDTFRPAVWLGALTVSAGMTAGLLRRELS